MKRCIAGLLLVLLTGCYSPLSDGPDGQTPADLIEAAGRSLHLKQQLPVALPEDLPGTWQLGDISTAFSDGVATNMMIGFFNEGDHFARLCLQRQHICNPKTHLIMSRPVALPNGMSARWLVERVDLRATAALRHQPLRTAWRHLAWIRDTDKAL